MTHATVFIILDAARQDYVQPDTMPFLHALAQESTVGSFESPPGFAQRTVLFSGRYPDTSGNFSQFVFDPEASPFGWTRWLGPLRDLIKPRTWMVPARWTIDGITKKLTGDFHTDPAWIPPRLLPFFAMCEDTQPVFAPDAPGAPSIFDLCRDHGLSFRYLAHPISGDDEEVHRLLVEELRDQAPYDLYVAQLSATDEQAHHHGPKSDEMRENVLPDIDAKLASVHAALETHYDTWDLFVCGDHGMAPVDERVDILGELAGIEAEPGEDYVVFVNSTLAVFWFLTDRGRHAVERLLPTIEGAREVTEEERRSSRIPDDRCWGDRMFAADPGVLFWPDYFHVTDRTIRGMHGYLDKRTEGLGAMVLASSRAAGERVDLGPRALVDVFPTLCNLLGLPVPGSQEGESLVADVHPPPPSILDPLDAITWEPYVREARA